MPQDIIINVRANTAQADKQLQNTERLVTKLYNSANNLVTAFQEQGRAAQQAWSSGIQPLLNGIVGLSSRTSGAIHAMNSLERINQRLVASTRNYASALAGLDFSRLNTLVGTMGSLAASFNRAKAALDDMSKSLATLNARTKDIHVTTHNAIVGFGRLGVTAREYLAYRGIKAVGLYADRYQDWINKLTASTGSQEAARGIIPNLHKVADSARADIDSIVTLYSRLNLANDHLKLKEDELVTVTKALSQSFILSGATSQEAKNAIIQFTQAISKGYLNGDELRSVTEQNIVFTRLLAKEMNTTAGGLRDLGAKGLLTAETLVKVLKNAAGDFDKQIAKMPVTFGQALQKMANAWQMTFSKIANDRQLGQSLVALTDALTKAFSNTATLKAVKLIIDSMKYLTENIHLVIGAVAGWIVQFRLLPPIIMAVRAALAGTLTMGAALTAVLAPLAGIITGAVVAGIYHYVTATDDSIEKAREQTSVINNVIDTLENLSDAYNKVSESIKRMSTEELRRQRDALKAQNVDAETKLALAYNAGTRYRVQMQQIAQKEQNNPWYDPKQDKKLQSLQRYYNTAIFAAYTRSLNAQDAYQQIYKDDAALSKVVSILTQVHFNTKSAGDAISELGFIFDDVRKNIKEGSDEMDAFNKAVDNLFKSLEGKRDFQIADTIVKDMLGLKEILEAAKLTFIPEDIQVDFAKYLKDKFTKGIPEIQKEFGSIFSDEKVQKDLLSVIGNIADEAKKMTLEEVKDFKMLLPKVLDFKQILPESLKQPGIPEAVKNAMADLLKLATKNAIDLQEQAIVHGTQKGLKAAKAEILKNLANTGQLAKLADARVVEGIDKLAEALAKVKQIDAEISRADTPKQMVALGKSMENAKKEVSDTTQELAALGVTLNRVGKEVYNYQKAITQNATSELLSLVGKGATVDDKALEAIYKRAGIKEEFKKYQAEMVSKLENAKTDKDRLDVYKEYLPILQRLTEAEHEYGKAIESRIEIANRDKEIQKQLDAFAKKGGKSEDIRQIVEMGFAINSLTKDLENLLEKSDYLRSGGFASSIRDAMLQFIEQLGESKQLLIDTQYEILKANKAMDGTDTLLRNIAEAIKLINEKGGIKNLSASELAEVQRISSNTKNALNKLNAEKDRLDELIAKLEGVKKSFEGVANAVLFVVKVMSAFGVVSKELVAKIEGMRDDLLQRIGAGIESAKATKDALTSKIAEMSTPFDTLNGLIKDTKDGTDRLGKSIEDLGEPLNSVDKAMHKWIEFQQNIPSFAETLESNMESAAKSVMNWKMDMVDAVSDVGSGIVKALVKGEDAMDSLKNTLSSLADHFIDMSIRMLTYQAFWGLIGGGMGMGGGLFSGLGAGLGSLFGFHQGGVIGSDSPTFIRKYHTGGIIGSDEELAILQNGEGVFTRGQMQAIGEGMSANRGNVMVDVRFDPSLKGEVTTEQEVIEQDNQMTKVVLNVIRNNKRTVSSMLGSNTRAQ